MNDVDKLIEILNTVCPDVDFEAETNLVEDGILTSLDIVMIVSELMAAYDVRLDIDDLVPENFENAGTIYELIQKAKGN